MYIALKLLKTLNCEITHSKSREECYKNRLGDGWRWDAVALESFATTGFPRGDNGRAHWFFWCWLSDILLLTSLLKTQLLNSEKVNKTPFHYLEVGIWSQKQAVFG